MKAFQSVFLLAALAFLFALSAHSQIRTETSPDQRSIAGAINIYYSNLNEQAGLYNGVEYSGYAHVIKDGHQYFESENMTTGRIFYDGMLYTDVPMWFDLIRDQVVVRYADSVSKIVLHNDKIKYFSLFGHNFVHHFQDTLESSSPSSGFYDQIYHGKTDVLVRRSKNFLERVSKDEGIWITILKQKNDHYLKKGETYYSINSEGAVLKALGSKQKEILQYLKKNKIKFRSDPDKAIVMMVSYFEQLNG